MRLNPLTITPFTIIWVFFALLVLRMAFRMLDGGAGPVHFALMGAGALVIAGLIAVAGRFCARWLQRRASAP
jgi:hypothetical protein